MFKEERSNNVIEAGESSDESIEEITEQDFNSRFWMSGGGRRDMFKYPGSSNYGSGLSNFAWAQAVQNKPFSESLVMREFQLTKDESKAKEVFDVASDDSSEEVGSSSGKVGSKEEEELEEGEIDLDSMESSAAQNDEELEKRIESIRETLENLAVNDSETYFDGVCLRLRTSLDDLQSIVSERKGVSELGALLDQAYARIQAVVSVFNSLNSKLKEQNKDEILRLLAHVKGQVPTLFSPEQMKEIQAGIDSLCSPPVTSRASDMQAHKDLQRSTKAKDEMGTFGGKHGLLSASLQDSYSERNLGKPGDQNNLVLGSENSRQGNLPGTRGRGSFGPLLDLHVDHDVDSLPSPTREAPPPSFIRERHVFKDGNMKSEPVTKVATKNADVPLQPYETDALKAVSSYQQKFRQSSFNLSSRLPSPTPSENSDGGDGDSTGEVSSSSAVGNVSSVNMTMPSQVVGSIAPNMDNSNGQRVVPMPLKVVGSVAPIMDNSNGQRVVPGKMIGQVASVPNSHLRPSSKTRDPRLRLLNHEVSTSALNLQPTPKTEPVGSVNMRKNKNVVGDTIMESRIWKKQKNDSTNFEVSRDVEMARIVGGLDSCSNVGTNVIDSVQTAENMKTDSRKLENGSNFSDQRYEKNCNFNANISRHEQLPATGTSTTTSLPSFWKDIAVNPTMLVQLIMEQQKLVTESRKSNTLSQDTMLAFSSSATNPSTSVPPSKSCDSDPNFVEKVQLLSQPPSMNPQADLAIRMKPRDPRRILHSNSFQKIESLGPEQSKMIRAPTSTSQASIDNLNAIQQKQQLQANCFPPKSTNPPDIAPQFTKNLRNLADIFSSKSTDSISTVTQLGGSFQPMPAKTESTDGRGSIKNFMDQHNGTTLIPEGITGSSRLQSDAWEDVEHLFEGYDDKQKAAIQRERSRRIGEQTQMFASKKLCLVLDLDHTLLNSAKFVEVEPVHEEILRKKEELDREKPRRHLFRLSHMGMWTKLRPGIWTFLEKASKLYELHLYTMGNKIYATEMAKLLDPTGVLFAGRVISKGDDGDPFDSDEKLPKCKDLEGVLGMESSVVIIDDSVKVWPHNKLNLILVERYTYFPCSRYQFGLPGPSLLEIDHDERPEDGTLASSLMVIEKLHKNFFSYPSLHEADIRNILASEQRKILAGCRILFSRIFPVGEAKPHQHPLWQTAEQFGAVCTTQIDNMVTHVVANSLGTDKVNWALSTGRFVVHPGWVEASALLYRRANENDFAVKINLP